MLYRLSHRAITSGESLGVSSLNLVRRGRVEEAERERWTGRRYPLVDSLTMLYAYLKLSKQSLGVYFIFFASLEMNSQFRK